MVVPAAVFALGCTAALPPSWYGGASLACLVALQHDLLAEDALAQPVAGYDALRALFAAHFGRVDAEEPDLLAARPDVKTQIDIDGDWVSAS